MKTERNGILETAWRKIVSFIKHPFFEFFVCVSLILLGVYFLIDSPFCYSAEYIQDKISEFPFYPLMTFLYGLFCGLFESVVVLSIIYFLNSLGDLYKLKSSGSAPDENIKNNKMKGNCKNEKND